MPDKKQAVQEEVDSDCLFGNCLFRFLLSKVEYQASFHLARVHFNKGFAGDRTGDDRSVPPPIITSPKRTQVVPSLEAHCPWEALIVAPLVRARRYKKMRYLLFVDIARDRRIERGAQRVGQQRNLVLLDQLAYLVHCLWRTVAVDFPMRNLGYCYQLSVRRRSGGARIIRATGLPCIRRGSFRFAGILPRLPA